jgi:hypothetical protein
MERMDSETDMIRITVGKMLLEKPMYFSRNQTSPMLAAIGTAMIELYFPNL